MRSDPAGLTGLPEALLLDAALESIPYGFCVWSPQLRLVMWNKLWRDIYGFPLSAMRRGMSLEDVAGLSTLNGNHFNQSAAEFYESYTAELLANRGGARVKSREILRGGRIVEAAHIFSPGLGWVVTHEDITEALAEAEIVQQSQRALEGQNLRLDAAVNNISQGLCMFDPHGRLVICNQPYAKIYGLPERLLHPGTPLEDILGHLFDIGMSTGGTREQYVDWRREVIARREFVKNVHELGGRTIMMQHHPMQDGGFVSTHEDVTEQRQNEARIRHLARHDALTDLPNRSQFLEAMAASEGALKRGERLAVLCIDLDRFKAVNDTLGHAIGDELLKQVAVRLWGTTRETDLLARVGGDEFCMLLRPVNGPRDAEIIAERIIKVIAAPIEIRGHKIDIGASVGIAMAPADGDTTDMLLKNADLALYCAKNNGRSTFHFFEPGMDAALEQRRSMEAGLRQALAKRELRLVYQPLLDLKRNRISCFEALLRWDYEGRTVSPAEFIPIAEETGLIVPIGEWVLREACRTAAQWRSDVRIAVNLSPAQFRHRSLGAVVKLILLETGLAPTRLELEITESLLLLDSEQTLATLHEFRALGVRISMDDFGTGYSSLSYLRSFPFDKIKIDRSFMRDLDTRSDSLAILKAIISLGHSLGMSTTAEGVETEAQLAAVRSQGCDEMQGFLFSRPLNPGAVLELLESEMRSLVRVA